MVRAAWTRNSKLKVPRQPGRLVFTMIGLVADDLTGAAELAGVGLRHGLRAQVVFSGEAGSSAELVCVDTDSRSCSAEEAARRVAEAVRQLVHNGARWVYKKVDSVLRGQVAAEIQAIMDELHLKVALLAPANPSLGRVIEDGRYFVHGKPLDQTEFAIDPEHPRTSAMVVDLLNAGSSVPVYVCKANASLPVRGIVIGEAASASDLQQWATRRSPEMLCAGGAEFFSALLSQIGASARANVKVNVPRPGLKLFVSGTLSGSSRQFIAQAATSGIPVFTLPQELARGGDFDAAKLEPLAQRALSALNFCSTVILTVGLSPVHEPAIAKSLHGWLARLAKVVLDRAEIGHVYAEGGATARELARQMGWQRLTVVEELGLGIATLAVSDQARPLLTIKPGSYTWPQSIRPGS
jgi:D-threonate/D-erythronate kinase